MTRKEKLEKLRDELADSHKYSFFKPNRGLGDDTPPKIGITQIEGHYAEGFNACLELLLPVVEASFVVWTNDKNKITMVDAKILEHALATLNESIGDE